MKKGELIFALVKSEGLVYNLKRNNNELLERVKNLESYCSDLIKVNITLKKK